MKSKMRLSPGTTRPLTELAKSVALLTCSTFSSWFRVSDHFACGGPGTPSRWNLPSVIYACYIL